MDILCYRIVFSALFMAILLVWIKNYSELRISFTSWREFKFLAARAFCLGVNWLIYIWGINNNYVIECSFGYFIMPLAVIFLSFVFLRERLNSLEIVSSLIAFAAVLNLGVRYDHFPYVALGLAFTFGCYALLRKTSSQGALSGLAAEVFILSPLAVIYMFVFTRFSTPAYNPENLIRSLMLILGTGLVTALPLILYAYGLRRIKMSTVGIFQYIVPSMTFILGVFLYKEHFSNTMLITFILIWLSVIIYIIHMLRDSRS